MTDVAPEQSQFVTKLAEDLKGVGGPEERGEEVEGERGRRRRRGNYTALD